MVRRHTPDEQSLGAALAKLQAAVRDLQVVDGTQLARSVEKVKALIVVVEERLAAIPGEVQAALDDLGVYTVAEVDALVAAPPTVNVSGPLYTPHGRANPVVTSYVAAYLNSDGRVGATPSSRRFKQQITSWSFEWQALFAIELFAFKYNAAVEELGNLAPTEVGLMAEDLDALGLTWLVVYDDDGMPWAVAYEKFSLVLLPVVQDHERRLRALEGQSQ